MSTTRYSIVCTATYSITTPGDRVCRDTLMTELTLRVATNKLAKFREMDRGRKHVAYSMTPTIAAK